MTQPVYLYIHIPFCISKCKYCDFFSLTQNSYISKMDEYIEALCKEIEFRCKQYKKTNKNDFCQSVYIGGGTPSLLPASSVEKILQTIKLFLIINNQTEITIETNPDDINEEYLEKIYALGINRISCGIQSLNDESLKFVKRRANRKQNLKALEILKNHWKGKLSIDLISALPYETENSFLEGLETIISINPEHISLYSLTIEDETPLGQELNTGVFDYDFDFADEMWLSGKKLLEDKGYEQYEVSNFCKKNEECIHNLAYWTHKDYLGCGSGACGSVYFDDGSGNRWTNTKDISKYINAWTNNQREDCAILENVSVEDSKYEFFMMGLRKKIGITSFEYSEIFKEDLPDNFIKLITRWQKQGLANIQVLNNNQNKIKNIRYALNNKGLLFLNQFLEEL